MERVLFIQKPVNEIQSFTNSQYQKIINGQKIHDTNIESYKNNDNVLIRGHIDNKPIYYNSRQKQNQLIPFRNKKRVSFSNLNSSNHRPIMRDLTPFHLMNRPSIRNNTMNKTRKQKQKKKQTKTGKKQTKNRKK